MILKAFVFAEQGGPYPYIGPEVFQCLSGQPWRARRRARVAAGTDNTTRQAQASTCTRSTTGELARPFRSISHARTRRQATRGRARGVAAPATARVRAGRTTELGALRYCVCLRPLRVSLLPLLLPARV